MSPEEYQQRIQGLIREGGGDLIGDVVVPAASELLATIKNRIVQRGQNSADTKIGGYSTDPAYYGKDAFIRKGSFKAQGKNGDTKFKNGNPHKTEYFPSGYKGLREKQGRKTDVMNMSYTGSTLLSYQMQGGAGMVLLGMTNQHAAEVRQGQEKKRGKIFYATQQEMAEYNRNVEEATEEVTRRGLQP